MSGQLHVAIIGAGLGGLAAAIGISRTGHRVTILEQAAELGEVGAGIQIPPSSSRVLDQWGLLGQIRAIATLPHDFHLRSRDGRILSTQNIRPLLEEKYGYPYFQVHRAGYHRILAREAHRLGVTIKLSANVVGIDFTKPSVSIKGDHENPDYEFPADLIIGADGLRSRCRESLLDRPDPPRLTGDLAYRATVKVSDIKKLGSPHLKALIQKPCTNYWMGPNLHAMCYFIEKDQICNLVLIVPDHLPEGVNVAAGDVKEMRRSFGGWDPALTELLGLVDSVLKWRLQDSVMLERWTHPGYKFVLLGDSCHATLPYLAQGAAQAIEDGAAIGALFSKLPPEGKNTSQYIPTILQIYEHLRKERTARIVQKSADFRAVFHMEDGPEQEERDRILLHEKPGRGFPFLFADPELQRDLFAYDVGKEVERAWEQHGQSQGKARRQGQGVSGISSLL